MTGVQTTKRDGPGQRIESHLALGPEEVRLGGGPVWRESGSTGPRGQVHRRQRARGARWPQVAAGAECPSGEGGGLGGVSECGHERPRLGQAGSRASKPGQPLPILMRGPSTGQTQALVRPASPPPRLPLCTHLRGSSRGSRPAPARLPIPSPGGDGRAGQRQAPRPGGRSGRRGCAGGRRRAADGGRAHSRSPCAPPAPGSLPAGKTAVPPLGSHPLQPRPGPIRLALSGSRPAPG